MKNRWINSLLILFLFVSCAPKQPEQDTEIIAIAPNTDVLKPKKPDCEWDNHGPYNYKVNDPVDAASPVTFSWVIDCQPDEYELFVTHFKNENTSVWQSNIDSNGYEYTKSLELEPATGYQWRLNAYDANGNILVNNGGWGYFRTGPLCGAEDLVPPTLVSPADGTIDTGKGGYSTEVHAVIKYPVGECLPELFEIDYSWNANFSGEDLFNLSGPTIGKKEGEWLFYGDDSSGTQDCNLYYWRARALSDSGYSDWSETFTFYLDIYGNCYTFPELKALKNANCRRDPWAGENYAGVVWEGETAELLGLNEDATWGMFKLKNEIECWVNMELLETDPPDAIFFPGYYPVLEHGEPPGDIPAPSPVDEPSNEGSPVGCMAPSGRSNTLVCQIPCPDPKYAARVCP